MIFSELNPFLRYGSTFLMKSHEFKVVSCDCHLHFVHKGGFTAFVENKKYRLMENSVYYCPKGTVYRFEIDDEYIGETMLTSLNFDFGQSENWDTKVRTPMKYSEDMLIKRDPLFEEFKNTESFFGEVRVFANAERYLPYFIRIMKEFQLQSCFSRDLCSCVLKELLILLHSVPENLSARETEFLKEIVEYINNNFKLPIDNKSIAEKVGYHPNYLGRIFKQYMNMSIHRYVLSLRISEAKNMICGSNLPFYDIAEKSGFGDYAYFSAYFKSKTGMSPSEYRRYHMNIV